MVQHNGKLRPRSAPLYSDTMRRFLRASCLAVLKNRSNKIRFKLFTEIETAHIGITVNYAPADIIAAAR